MFPSPVTGLSLGGYDKIPQTVSYKQDLFLIVLEAGKSNIKVLADSMSGEGPLPHS